MPSLLEGLKSPKISLEEFLGTALRVLQYLPAVVKDRITTGNYVMFVQESSSRHLYTRPVREELFISSPNELEKAYGQAIKIFQKIKEGLPVSGDEQRLLDQFIYTLQQSMGLGMDLLAQANAARKHLGIRFEELLSAVFNETGKNVEKAVQEFSYQNEGFSGKYKVENDLIVRPLFSESPPVRISSKITSKDRMGKIYLDKILLEKFTGRPQKMVAVFLHDVQRKGTQGVSYTLVPGLLAVYQTFLSPLDGIYYLDVPPSAKRAPLNRFVKPFSELLVKDLPLLLSLT
ncbi:MAG: hypothetical protein GXO27_03695 [Chlorobi bacterium]|nr:hypothetical protein [Chlorobiota bacterium]